MKKPVVLRIYKGDQLQGVKQFVDSQIVIGRQDEIQVVLAGDAISLIHAAIEERESGYYLCDLGSETGTFINGEPVLDGEIQSGDTVQIGDYRIEFYVGVPKPRHTPPPISTPPAAATSTAAPVVSVVTPTPVEAPVAEPTPVAAPPAASTPVQASEVTPTPSSEPTPSAEPTPTVTSTPEPVVSPTPVSTPVSVAPAEISTPVSSPTIESAAPLFPMGAQEIVVPSFGLAGPKSRAATRTKLEKKSKKGQKTFAPESRFKSVKEFVKPTKGTVVEVLVAWKERVIATYHFAHRKTVTLGSHPDNDIVLPVFSSRVRKLPILRIESQAIALVTPEMTGELIRGQTSSNFAELLRQNRLVKEKNSYAVSLEQGEMIKIDLGEQISVVIRYVSDSPKPLVAPLLDLTASEFTGVVLAIVLVTILRLFMMFHSTPKLLPDEGDTEPLRTAMIIMAAPSPPPLPPPSPQVEAPAPPPVEEPPKEVVKVKVAEKKSEDKRPTQTKASTNLTNKNDPGQSANAAPNKNKTGPRIVTAPKTGGAIKTTDKEGSQMRSRNKDVSKSGIFSVFGGGGANDQLAQSTSGSGELAGLAGAASGRAGFAEDRPGQGLGSSLKDTGRGGTGQSLEGIAGGVGTSGRGSGNTGYGTGGLGDRAGVKIITGGAEESFSGTIDREAIRRVIRANLRVIRTCFERQLNRNPDLSGKIVLGWDIGEQGRVLATRVKSNELGNREVADCIMERLKTWRFPEPPTNQVVEVEAYPFVFKN